MEARRESAKGAREKNLDGSLATRELDRTTLPPPEEFVFLLLDRRSVERDRYEEGEGGGGEGESTSP